MLFNQQLTGMQKKHENMTHIQDKCQSLEAILDITEMIELASHEVKTVLDRFYMFCKVDET